VTIADRIKDMYISGGENVYPAEVEDVLLALPGVAECAVIGVPDERWGEVGRAFVVPADDAAFAPGELLAALSGRLAKYKIPKSVVLVEELPRTASGKLLKHRLRAEQQ
jgi:fatty-acyl-CoA synthase